MPNFPGPRDFTQPLYTAMVSTRRTDEQYTNIVVEVMTAAVEVRRIRDNQLFRAQYIARRLREELTRVLTSHPVGPESRPRRQEPPQQPWLRNLTQLSTPVSVEDEQHASVDELAGVEESKNGAIEPVDAEESEEESKDP